MTGEIAKQGSKLKNNVWPFYVVAIIYQLFLAQVQLRTEVSLPPTQVRPDRGLNSWPPDHDSTSHVTEMPVLITTRPSVTKNKFSATLSLRSDFKCVGSQTDALAIDSFGSSTT